MLNNRILELSKKQKHKVMKVTNEIRSKVLKSAWKMWDSCMGNKDFSDCLRDTWAFYKSKNYFQKPEVTFVNLPKIVKESAKAIAFQVTLECMHTHQVINKLVWIPRSLTKAGQVQSWFLHKKLQEVTPERSSVRMSY